MLSLQFIDKKYKVGHHYVYEITRHSGDSFTKVRYYPESRYPKRLQCLNSTTTTNHSRDVCGWQVELETKLHED